MKVKYYIFLCGRKLFAEHTLNQRAVWILLRRGHYRSVRAKPQLVFFLLVGLQAGNPCRQMTPRLVVPCYNDDSPCHILLHGDMPWHALLHGDTPCRQWRHALSPVTSRLVTPCYVQKKTIVVHFSTFDIWPVNAKSRQFVKFGREKLFRFLRPNFAKKLATKALTGQISKVEKCTTMVFLLHIQRSGFFKISCVVNSD